jgi:hypothetical protein
MRVGWRNIYDLVRGASFYKFYFQTFNKQNKL